MKLLISPAKKMRRDLEFLEPENLPIFLPKTERLLGYLRGLSYEELRNLLRCNDQIAGRSFRQYAEMDLYRGLTPALLAYDGIQYTYMSPGVFTYAELDYIRRHLRILSGFYGLLRPFDGVAPYRLEMQTKLRAPFCESLYDYWGEDIYKGLTIDDKVLVNLASHEYSRAVERYLTRDITYITCRFGRLSGGRFIEKGVHVKMARGQMVRYLAENQVVEPMGLKGFDRLGYSYNAALSDDCHYFFTDGGE